MLSSKQKKQFQEERMLELKVGDKAVYPALGVGEVTGIEVYREEGTEQTVYVLTILDNGMKVTVPALSAEEVGMRALASEGDIDTVFDILKEQKLVIKDNVTWNRRYREYMDMIKSGSLFKIAQVMRDLYLLKNKKELSFGEKRLLELARNLLVKEISIAKNTEENKIEERIESVLLH